MRSDVLEALADDLNTPKAIAENARLRNASGRKALAGTLAFFGFRARRTSPNGARPARRRPRSMPEEIDRRIAARARRPQGEELRRGRPHPRRARALGIVLKDSKDGTTTWEVAR